MINDVDIHWFNHQIDALEEIGGLSPTQIRRNQLVVLRGIWKSRGRWAALADQPMLYQVCMCHEALWSYLWPYGGWETVYLVAPVLAFEGRWTAFEGRW